VGAIADGSCSPAEAEELRSYTVRPLHSDAGWTVGFRCSASGAGQPEQEATLRHRRRQSRDSAALPRWARVPFGRAERRWRRVWSAQATPEAQHAALGGPSCRIASSALARRKESPPSPACYTSARPAGTGWRGRDRAGATAGGAVGRARRDRIFGTTAGSVRNARTNPGTDRSGVARRGQARASTKSTRRKSRAQGVRECRQRSAGDSRGRAAGSRGGDDDRASGHAAGVRT